MMEPMNIVAKITKIILEYNSLDRIFITNPSRNNECLSPFATIPYLVLIIFFLFFRRIVAGVPPPKILLPGQKVQE